MPDNNVKDKLVTLEALKLVNDINLPKDLSELDSVPNEVTVSSTDIIAMQVDGTTYKLPVSALASALKATGNYVTSSEVANDLTTATAGKVLDARQGATLKNLIDSLELPDISEATHNSSWKSAPIGISHYYYDEQDASATYGVPVDNCFVVVMRSDGDGSQSRGVAIAFRWTRGSEATTSSNDIWISTLQDEDDEASVEWFAWTQITYDVLPLDKGGTGANSSSGALSNLGGVSKTGDTMTGTLYIKNSYNYTNLSLSPNDDCRTEVITTGDNSGSRIRFRTYPTGSNNFEDFVMPFTSSSISTNTPYEILTTKPMSVSVQSAARTALGNSWHSIFDGFLQNVVTSTGTDVDIASYSVTLPAGTYLVLANAFVHQNTGSGKLKFKYGSTSIEAVISSGHVGASAGVYAMVMGTITSTGSAQTVSLTINSSNASYTMTAKNYMQYRAISIRI